MLYGPIRHSHPKCGKRSQQPAAIERWVRKLRDRPALPHRDEGLARISSVFSQARSANGLAGRPGTAGRKKKNSSRATDRRRLLPPSGETQKSMASDNGIGALLQLHRGEMSTGETLSPAAAGVGDVCSPSAQPDWRRDSSSSHVDFWPRKGGFQPKRHGPPPGSTHHLF